MLHVEQGMNIHAATFCSETKGNSRRPSKSLASPGKYIFSTWRVFLCISEATCLII